jgi:hypothetical protein
MGYAARSQQRYIDEARKVLGLTEIEVCKVPRWLSSRLAGYRRENAEVALLSGLMPDQLLLDVVKHMEDGQWLDYWGMLSSGPFQCCHGHEGNLVDEPYYFGSDTALALDKFCQALGGLVWHVSSDSWRYPGCTVRITIHPE